jgi:cell division septum initiation protein DivIVA
VAAVATDREDVAEQPKSKSLRDYASFELERKGYDRAQVDAFLSELDQAFIELETSVKERGNEIAQLQSELERLKRESPVGRSEEILRRAEANAEQMMASSLSEGQQIIADAEKMAMRIIANARAQSQELASQPPGFGMLARVRTVAADIERIKAEHAALMQEQAPLPSMPVVIFDDPEEPQAMDAATEQLNAAVETPQAADGAPPDEEPPPQRAAKRPATEGAAGVNTQAVAERTEESVADPEPIEVPRIQLVEPPLIAAVPDLEEAVDVTRDTKHFDWKAARQEVLQALDQEESDDPLADDEVVDSDEVDPTMPTIMRRQGSRYERHSASLPKIGNEGESALSDVSKVSRRRRRRAAIADDDSV